MANIRKSFNFREGVKVDDSVLVVVGDRVGIGSTIPLQAFEVTGNTAISEGISADRVKISGISTFMGNVGIGTTNITAAASSNNTTILNAGIVTAISYYGDGSKLSNIPATPFSSATYGRYVLSTNIGIGSTNPVYDLQVGNDPESGNGVGIDSLSGNIKTSGIITATKFVGPFEGNVIGQADYALVAAAATTAGYATTAGISTTSKGLTGTPDISVSNIVGTSATFTGVCTATGGFVGDLTGNADTASVALALSQGASYSADNIIGGIGSFGSVGIGSTNPVTDIQILNSNNAVITLGREASATGNNGAIGFGKVSGSFPYSDANSLDILNYGIGNINFYVEAGSVGVTTGSFYWHRRGNYSRLMALTYEGKLGIGVTEPEQTLHVSGGSTVSNKAWFGNDVEIAGDITAQGLSATSLSITQLTANLVGNVNAAGLSTFTDVKITSKLGINTDAAGAGLYINSEEQSFIVNDTGKVGIGTANVTDIPIGINALNTRVIVGGVGIGTTLPRSVADFGDAGATGIVTTNRFLLPPKITTTERGDITSLQDGALIYNTSLNRLEVYPNSTKGWVGISTGGDGGVSALNDLSDVNAGAPADDQALSWDSASSKWIPQTFVTDDSRDTKAGTTGSIAKDASADLNITGFKSYALLKVAIDAPAWVVLYTDTTSRSNDSGRTEGTDPTPGSGVIAEVLTTTAGASTFKMSPGVIGWNDDGSPSTTIYAKVKNKRSSSGSNTITVTLTVLKLES